jgi:hypothetical protein
MRAIRDDISHNGSRASVFGSPTDGILFQVIQNNQKYVIPTIVTHIYYNDYVIFFNKYFAIQFSHLMNFINSLSSIIINKLNFPDLCTPATGFDTVALWVNSFVDELAEKL